MPKIKYDRMAARKLEAENPDPAHYGVSFRKGEPILVHRSILRWRKWRRLQLEKKKAENRRIAKNKQSVIAARAELRRIINPFAADDSE